MTDENPNRVPRERFDPPSRDPATRDPEPPTTYRLARWAAIALVGAATMPTAWWLVQAGVVGWLAGLPWDYLSWLPFVD